MTAMTEQSSWTWKKRTAVLGAWFVLIVLLGLFQWWRFERWHTLHPPEGFPVVPIWLPVVQLAVVAAGFALATHKRVGGTTPLRRYWAMVFVGVLSMASIALVAYSVLRHGLSRCFYGF